MIQNRKINPWSWQDAFGFSQAIETSGHTRVLRCAGQTSVSAEGAPMRAGDMAAQIAQALDNLETVLKAADMALSNVVDLTVYVTDMDAALQHFAVAGGRLAGAGIQPAITLIGVTRLFSPDIMIEIQATAVA